MKKVENVEKIFSICAFYDYVVDYTCMYSCRNEDGDFVEREVKQSYEVEGGSLQNSIAELILSCNCVDFEISENQIQITHFDPNYGEDSIYTFKIKERNGNVIEK